MDDEIESCEYCAWPSFCAFVWGGCKRDYDFAQITPSACRDLVTMKHVTCGRYYKALFCAHDWSEYTFPQGLLQVCGDEQIYGVEEVNHCSKCDAIRQASYKEIRRGPIEVVTVGNRERI